MIRMIPLVSMLRKHQIKIKVSPDKSSRMRGLQLCLKIRTLRLMNSCKSTRLCTLCHQPLRSRICWTSISLVVLMYHQPVNHPRMSLIIIPIPNIRLFHGRRLDY